MLGFMFNKVGGLVKDLQVAVTDTVEYVYDEVSSIPSEIMKGYDSGLISGTTEEPLEADAVTPAKDITQPSVNTPETAVRRFGA